MPRKLAILMPVLCLGLWVDQLTKLMVARSLALGATVPVIPGFFNLVHVHNRGAAFGLLAGWSAQFAWLFFVATTCLVVVVMGYLWWRQPPDRWLAALSYSLIITGALGNLIDRVRLGEVIDFLDFYWRGHHWPAFNVADSLVCVGAAFLVRVILREENGNASNTV
jgi:signal peptidase II